MGRTSKKSKAKERRLCPQGGLAESEAPICKRPKPCQFQSSTPAEARSRSTASERAMRIPLVLSLIVPRLQQHELMLLRQTCKSWADIFALELHGRYFPYPRALDTAQALVECTAHLRKSQNAGIPCPYGEFTIKDTICATAMADVVANSSISPVTDFFSVCRRGPSIMPSRLVLVIARPPDADLGRIHRQIISEQMPDLTELSIKVLESAGTDDEADVNKIAEALTLTRRMEAQFWNLRRLEFRDDSANWPYDHRFLPSAYVGLLPEILDSAPDLRSVRLHGAHQLTALSASRVRLSCIKTLHMDDKIACTAPVLEILIRLADPSQPGALRPQEFGAHLRFWYCDAEEAQNELRTVQDLFHAFLATQSDTLLRLELRIESDRCYSTHTSVDGMPAIVHVPRMPALRSLRLTLDQVKQWPWPLQFGEFGQVGNPGLGLADTFPALTRLDYNFTHGDDGQDPTPTVEPEARHDHDGDGDAEENPNIHPGVTDLTLKLEADIQMEVLASFCARFPAVTRLELNLDYWRGLEQWATIWSAWPDTLTSIHVHYSQHWKNHGLDLDEVLTGIPKAKHKFLLTQVRSTPSSNTNANAMDTDLLLARFRSLRDEFKTTRGLPDQKCLQRFVLDVKCYAYSVTDIGGYLGFALANPGMQYMAIVGHEACLGHHARAGGGTDPGSAQELRQRNLITAECRQLIRSAFSPCTAVNL